MSPEASGPAPGIVDRAGVGLPWLVRLRWGAMALGLAAVGVAYVLGETGPPPLRVMACIAVTGATNLLLARQPRLGGLSAESLIGVVLSLDVVLFTVVLEATGGPSNPFSVLYLVYITLAAVVLRAGWTWAIASLAILCFGALFLFSGSPSAHAGHQEIELHMHLRGMWLAFAVAAVLTAYFVVKLSAAIERRDAELAAVRERAGRSERLAALSTLAAGAAHELGTPLATIALAAGELERAVRRLPERHARTLREDSRLIRSELGRCRRILDQMSVEAGEPGGEALVRMRCSALVEEALAMLPAGDASRVELASMPHDEVVVPRRALLQAIGSILRNALDATADGGRVAVSLAVEPRTGLRLAVRDDGLGMSAEVLAHAGEPFFSTKPAGRGLGLGLFLTRALAERMGGRLSLQSAPGAGTTAAIELPADVLAPRTAHA